MQTLNRILITGASGGLGAALACEYAAPNRTLLLWGRNVEQLEAVASACREAGAHAIIRSLDLVDCNAAIAAIEEEDAAGAIDLALLCAGLGDVQAEGELTESPEQIIQLGQVNFIAPSAMAAALARRMAARRRGAIVLIGSAAAFHSLPFAGAYAGSKAGLARFSQALRIAVARYDVRVTLVSPGFIETPAGRSTSTSKPFLMQPSYVAARIAKAVAQGKSHLILPWPFALLRLLDRLLPARARDRLLLGLAPPSA